MDNQLKHSVPFGRIITIQVRSQGEDQQELMELERTSIIKSIPDAVEVIGRELLAAAENGCRGAVTINVAFDRGEAHRVTTRRPVS